jgi:hypothetical protein
MNDSISMDLNVQNYSEDDLLQMLNLSSDNTPDIDNLTYNDIVNASNPLINRFTSEDNYDLANFFQQVQNKLLSDIDGNDSNTGYGLQGDDGGDVDDDNDEGDVNSDDDTYGFQDDDMNTVNDSDVDLLDEPNNQLGNLYQNEYPTQEHTDSTQYDKTTDRKQQVNIFEQDGKFVMNKNQLGVNNTYNLPVAQGQMNPTLKNTTSRIINIDSNYRDNIIPYTTDPDGPSSPTNFTLDLSDPIFNALSINLTSYNIPNTMYLIDSYQGNNCFFVDSSMVEISSGNYSVSELITEISNNSIFSAKQLDISNNSITGKTTITNTDVSGHTITFYDPSGILICDTTTGNSRTTSKFNNNLGWILGFRGNINIPSDSSLYGQLVYPLDASGNPSDKIISESIIDTFGSKYLLLVLDDFNQNHLNKGLVGITPTQKNAEIPSYWNADLRTSGVINCNVPANSSKKTASYTQNAPRRLTQAQLYTLNQTTQARAKTNKTFLTSPTTTDVLALIPLRKHRIAFGDPIIDDFNLDDAERVYFGPVDLERMRVRLVDDKGNTVNLNGSNWSFTLTATSLYQY